MTDDQAVRILDVAKRTSAEFPRLTWDAAMLFGCIHELTDGGSHPVLEKSARALMMELLDWIGEQN